MFGRVFTWRGVRPAVRTELQARQEPWACGLQDFWYSSGRAGGGPEQGGPLWPDKFVDLRTK
eukprot:8235423-Pyramimonas_sp.AAC.2